MADLEQLKQKYAPVLNTMNEFAPYNHYQKIAEANHLANPDKIQVGQQITVPALS